jgi:hypothetical protein
MCGNMVTTNKGEQTMDNEICVEKNCKQKVFTFFAFGYNVPTPFCSYHGQIDIVNATNKQRRTNNG